MPNDSSTGGYLAPSLTEGAIGIPYDDFLQATLAQIAALPGTLVRPRWQPKPPPLPERDVTWLALNVVNSEVDTNAYHEHDPTGEGSHRLERHETSEVLLSAYGPQSDEVLYRIRDGFEIRQNREALRAAGIAYRECGRMVMTADLRGTEFISRTDMLVVFRRVIRRVYPILNLLSAQGSFAFDDGSPPQTFNVEQ